MESKKEITRREFIKKILKMSAGAAMFSILPTTVNAMDLSDIQTENQFEFDDMNTVNNLKIPDDTKIKVIKDIRSYDEDMIGTEVIGEEGMLLHDAHLNFAQKFVWRNKTDSIVIHHVGNTDKNVNSATIHRWHLRNGWAGIGYHYIIRKDGTVEKGRPVNAVGAHCYNQNEHTVGICVVGNFELSLPTREQCRSAEELVGLLCKMYQIKPNSNTVRGHKDYNRTDCPGTYLYQWIPDIIKNANNFC